MKEKFFTNRDKRIREKKSIDFINRFAIFHGREYDRRVVRNEGERRREDAEWPKKRCRFYDAAWIVAAS